MPAKGTYKKLYGALQQDNFFFIPRIRATTQDK